VREFGTILNHVQQRLADDGFAVSTGFLDASCQSVFMTVSRDGISHAFSVDAKGRRSLFTVFNSESFKLCPQISIQIPGKKKEKLHEVTEEEYYRTPANKAAERYWKFSKYRVLKSVPLYETFQTYGMSPNGAAVNADKDVEIAQFISGQMGDMARERKFAQPFQRLQRGMGLK
jgi:hypothetical protein